MTTAHEYIIVRHFQLNPRPDDEDIVARCSTYRAAQRKANRLEAADPAHAFYDVRMAAKKGS